MKRFAIALSIAASLAWAQAPTNSGPVLGFVPGSMPWQLQPILGIPGAARLGDPLSLPNTVTHIYLAPGQAYAVAAQGSSLPAALVILRIAGVMQTNPALAPLPGALANPDVIAFSPTGQSLALFSQAASRIQVFTGLPNSPRISEQISNVGNALKLAVSDDAQAVLISDGAGDAYALAQNSAPVAVYHTTEIAAIAFLPQSHDAILCDPVAATAAVARPIDGITIIPPPASACQPEAAAASGDGKTILLACPAQRLIWSIDRASGSIDTHRVNNSPAAFESLGLQDTFLISPADANGTYWLVTWQSEGPVISFVGAARNAGAGN
jgi:hypothetical protein